MTMLPTFYKLRTGRRAEPCLLCMTRTRGRTVDFDLGYGETVVLCAGHASREFRYQRGGRDFHLSVARASAAAGCLGRNRERALKSTWEQTTRRTQEETPARPLPGSYAWPDLRRLVEDACQRGVVTIAKLRELIEAHLRAELRRGRIRLPSNRTLRRWRAERRWDIPAQPT